MMKLSSRTKQRLFHTCSLFLAALTLTLPPAQAASYIFSTFDAPAATSTVPLGINSAGHIVGEKSSAGGSSSAFLKNGTTFSAFAVSGASRTGAFDINNAGQIVGYSVRGSFQGFLTTADAFGTTTPISVPGYTHTVAEGINDAGQVVGYFGTAGRSAFLRQTDGSYEQFSYAGKHTWAFGINDLGIIVGSWSDQVVGGIHHAWIRNAAGQFTTFDVPLARSAYATDVNNDGWIVGFYEDVSGQSHGFVRDAAGDFTFLDVPGGSHTEARGINDAGQITGFYISGQTRGFVATVPESSSLLLFGTGIAGLVSVHIRKRRMISRDGVTA